MYASSLVISMAGHPQNGNAKSGLAVRKTENRQFHCGVPPPVIPTSLMMNVAFARLAVSLKWSCLAAYFLSD
jgi:hypothetical protein